MTADELIRMQMEGVDDEEGESSTAEPHAEDLEVATVDTTTVRGLTLIRQLQEYFSCVSLPTDGNAAKCKQGLKHLTQANDLLVNNVALKSRQTTLLSFFKPAPRGEDVTAVVNVE